MVAPNDTTEIAEIVRIAARYRIPVVARGAGSNLCAAAVPHVGGIVITTSRMRTVLEISPEELLARVQAGVTTSGLDQAARIDCSIRRIRAARTYRPSRETSPPARAGYGA